MLLKLLTTVLFSVLVTSQVLLSRKNPEIYRLHIVSDIAFRFATTNVTSYLANNADTAQEVEFKVTLPHEAFISNFSMVIEGVLYQGDVKEKKAAQKQYDKAKKKGQSAGQVKAKSAKESNVFKIQINIAAWSKVEFSLTYQELLHRRLGLYEHVINIDPGQVVNDLKVIVTLRESSKITLLKVPELRTKFENSIEFQENPIAVVERLSNHLARITYEPDTGSQVDASSDGITGQFVVQYDVERALSGGEIQVVDGYFVHFFAPNGLDPVPKNILFILDISGSMSGDKIQQVKEAMQTILDDLRVGDKFNIATFSDYVYYWEKEGMVEVNEDTVDRAKAFITEMSIFGGTNINDALLSGVRSLKTEREAQMENKPSIMIFLTDGQPTSGVVDTEVIAQNLRTANQGKTTLFALGFGTGVDTAFLTKIALQNNGFARKIYVDADPTLQLQNFYEEVSTPLLAEVKLTYLDDMVDQDSLTTSDFDSYFQGSEIVVAGKLQNDRVSNIISQVSGHSSSGYMEMDVEVNLARLENRYKRYDFPHITERLWAYLTIKKMLSLMIETSDPVVKADAEKKALAMALKYDFVTPLTSMVVTKPQEPDKEVEEDKEDTEAVPKKPSKRVSRPASKQPPARKSFVDNDPHFVVRVDGMEEGICFDVNGLPGDIFQLIFDKKNDIVVNGEVNAPDMQPPNLSHVPTYFSKIALMHDGVSIRIEPRKVLVNHRGFSWKPSSSQVIHDLALTFTSKKYLVIKIGSNIELIVIRHLSKLPNPKKMDYLGFYIQKGDGLGKGCHGLLGQFQKLKVEVLPEDQPEDRNQTMLTPDDQISGLRPSPDRLAERADSTLPERSVRMLQITSSDGNQRHIVAHLGHRRDMTLKEHIPCWHIRNNGQGLLKGKFKDYIVPKLTFRHFAIKNSISKKQKYHAVHSLYLEQSDK